MKRCASSVVAASLLTAVALAGAGGAILFRGGISALPEPSQLEAVLARGARRLAIPSAARDMANPVRGSTDVLASARAHFADHCASCHGNDGAGRTALGSAMYPRPPDLSAGNTQRLTDGELFFVIENGVRFTGMPAFGGAERPAESWKLVHFIRHLPMQSKEEVREMEQMNPRTPAEWRELHEDDAYLEGGGAEPRTTPPHAH